MVAVAQLVESRIVIPVVVGSSPISHPTLPQVCQPIRRGKLRFAARWTPPTLDTGRYAGATRASACPVSSSPRSTNPESLRSRSISSR